MKMEKRNIILYALSACSKCKAMVEYLNEAGIEHRLILCEDSSYKCDEVEKTTNCYMYPMIDVIKKKYVDRGGFGVYIDDHTILYLASNYEEGSKKIKLSQNYTGIPVLTLTEMLEKLKKETKQ